MKKTYDESDIRVLKGLEPVRARPGMYTRTDDPLHIMQEVLDNATDEALSGNGKKIVVRAFLDGSVEIQDEGRGIPVGIHPTEGVPVVELVFTKLHAGGKFNKADADSSYRFSGGLHGVGVSVTNALSTRLEVEVHRDGAIHTIAFSGGEVIEPVARKGKCEKSDTGTRVRAWPDSSFFDNGTVPLKDLRDLVRSKATLLKGVEFVFCREITPGAFDEQSFLYENGITQYLKEQLEGSESDIFFSGEKFSPETQESIAKGEGAEYAICFSEAGSKVRASYVNLIPTTLGGTHDAGLRDGIFTAVRNFIDANNMAHKGLKVTSEDVCSNLSYVLAAKVLDPQFQGQIKEKLNSRDAVKLVSWSIKAPFEFWLADNVDTAKKIAEMAIRAAQARQKSAQKIERKKSSGVATLPGKLTDCETDDLDAREVFFVEGDSAGGSAKMGRDKECQAILPLRGKVLNSWETAADQLLANTEIHDIAVAIGVDPHAPTDKPDMTGLRYKRICILSDADVDGSHIQVLLLTLFYKHFPELIRQGLIYIAQPPLFRIDVAAAGKGKPARKFYCLDEDELRITLEKLQLEGLKDSSYSVSRFKGLGEMSPEQLWETTLNPDTRRLVRMQTEDFTGEVFTALNKLMGKKEAHSRRALLEDFGDRFESES